MVDRRSRESSGSSSLRIALVELLPTDLGTVLVRLGGTWRDVRPRGDVVLIVRDRDSEHRFDPLAQTSQASARAAGGKDAFRATFSVPEALRHALGGGFTLEVGGEQVSLPYPEVGADDDGPAADGATVIDRAVLAERRARRAELAEETTARRATEAEQAIAGMEAELAKLELRLERAVADRQEIEAALTERDRRVRSAGQKAHAEQRLREEAVGEAAERAHAAEAEAAQLRTALARADTRATTLAEEVESLRRRAAEAQNEVATATASRRRIERTASQVTQRMASLDTAESEVAAARTELEHTIATANVVRVQLGTMRDELGLASRSAAGGRGGSAPSRPGARDEAIARDQLAGEQRAGAAASSAPRELERRLAEVESAREEALALQQQLGAREEANQRLQSMLSGLESEAERLRAENAQHGARRAAADQLVRGLMAGIDELREQIAAIEREQRLAEARAAETQAAVAEREQQLQSCQAAEAALRAELEAARGDLHAARTEVEGAHAQMRASHDQIEVARRELASAGAERDTLAAQLGQGREHAAGLLAELERERAERVSLEAGFAEQQAAAAEAGEAVRLLEHELEQRVLLQARAQQVVADVRTQLEGLRVEADERTRRETSTEGLVNEFMATAGEALEEAEQRIEEARRAAADIQRQLDTEREERDAMERELRDVLARERMEGERRIAALSDELRAELSGGVRELERNLDEETGSARVAVQRPPPWLPAALTRMAHDEPETAGQLALGLLPGQSAVLTERLNYDVELQGAGWYRVTVGDGAAEIGSMEGPRPRVHADFRVRTDDAGLAALVAHGDTSGLRVRATRRRGRARASLRAVPASLLELHEAGARPAPSLVYLALAAGIASDWTAGHEFAVEQELSDGGAGCFIVVHDGKPVVVTETRPAAVAATVRLSYSALAHLLSGEPPAPDDKPAIRGDAVAVARLNGWLRRAQGLTADAADPPAV